MFSTGTSRNDIPVISYEAQKLHIYNAPPESPDFYEDLKIDQDMRNGFVHNMETTPKLSGMILSRGSP
jgi:hypothetical protein